MLLMRRTAQHSTARTTTGGPSSESPSTMLLMRRTAQHSTARTTTGGPSSESPSTMLLMSTHSTAQHSTHNNWWTIIRVTFYHVAYEHAQHSTAQHAQQLVDHHQSHLLPCCL
ncbi:hypothetical protein Fcan01_11216 [Folsomia candida]|uniref:Uncharacterized protein n=1 Tax=Folsomia candida TaxID=158441 RepID=A0A226EC82_FOLCA|nr:hypothetical protein Fcan01_11216 [Folsomia candida]